MAAFVAKQVLGEPRDGMPRLAVFVRSERQRGLSSDARSADESGRDALPALGEQEVRRKLGVLGGGLGERLLECPLAAGLAGNRQLRGPNGDAADERCGALAARDLDWCAPT
jgi:hypothetical protein